MKRCDNEIILVGEMNNGYIYSEGETQVTFSDKLSHSNYTDRYMGESNNKSNGIPGNPNGFNPDIYSTVLVPKNILRTIGERDKEEDKGGKEKMIDWKYWEFTAKEQKEFIERYYPDRIKLYKKYKIEQEKTNLFIYLWMYMNGGIYIGPGYEILKSLDNIIEKTGETDIYLTKDVDRYISAEFFGSKAFCGFWLEVIEGMEKRKEYKYNTIKEEIDRNSGRSLLTDIVQETFQKMEIIPRLELDPYEECDIEYDKDTYLRPKNKDFISRAGCKIGTSTEVIYIIGIIIVILIIMITIALIT